MSAESKRKAKRLPIVCELLEGGRRSRRAKISRELFSGCEDVRELEDGYEFVFPGGKEWIERLAHFVAEEKGVLSLLHLRVTFRAGLGSCLAEDARTGGN